MTGTLDRRSPMPAPSEPEETIKRRPKTAWAPLELSGQRFGRLTVIRRAENDKRYRTQWLTHCDCGTEKVVKGDELRHGKAISCGCWRASRFYKHGRARTRLYKVWTEMKQRCQNHKDNCFERYGGRGIKVCERWASFENFRLDMGEPASGLSLERVDLNGHYCPENCIWATATQQANNTSRNHFLDFQGVTRSVAQWAKTLGIRETTLHGRLRRGWSVEDALSTPVRRAV